MDLATCLPAPLDTLARRNPLTKPESVKEYPHSKSILFRNDQIDEIERAQICGLSGRKAPGFSERVEKGEDK
jgi:hypothetical protein